VSARTSIVIPVHGKADLTRRCLDAVLATAPNAEVVVVDDASPDETPAVLESYGDAIRTVTLPRNEGYALACNHGVEASAGELLVLLNNDTEPRPGWLDALIAYADAHPAAAIVGAKLVYPTGAVQHAGVAFGQDGYPHNLYAGFAADHPAVNRPRRLQAVTGACMLIRRDAFATAGGFDAGFTNSLEDVDLCLRVGEAGGEVHLCPDAVVEHLESATRGRDGRFEASVARYRERWRDRVTRDDLALYAADGLIEMEYPDSYPLRMAVSPRLAVVDDGRASEIEPLLETYARQVSDLLQEVVRLTVAVGEGGTGQASPGASEPQGETDHEAFQAEARRIEEDVRRLQTAVASRNGSGPDGFEASRRLGYRHAVERLREDVLAEVPPGATVLVVSRGDRELLSLRDRDGRHFPQGDDGGYLGHHPRDGADAIDRLERLREAGAEYLVVPRAEYWWFDQYADFANHLSARYQRFEHGSCVVYLLDNGADTGLDSADVPKA